MDKELIKESVKNIIIALGDDPDREGLKETPKRVAKMFEEVFEGMQYSNAEIAQMFKKGFKVNTKDLVVESDIPVFSYCEHHLALMYDMKVSIAYLPNGTVLGLSKLARIADMCAKRLQLQERLGADIAECIQLATGSDKVYVRSVMDHGCVSARGAKSSGVTDVTYITQELRKDSEARKEIECKVQELHLSAKYR